MIPTFLAILGSRAALAGPCDAAVPASKLESSLSAAEAAYQALDVDEFNEALDGAAIDLTCLSEPATRPMAARYHRLRGLRLFVMGDRGAASQAFAAARTAEPAYTFPDSLLPAVHPARVSYEGAPASRGSTEPVAEPVDGTIRLDGTAARARATDRPALGQYIGGGGDVRWTAYLLAGEPMPSYESKPVPLADAAAPLLPAEAAPEARRSPALLAAGGGAIALGAVSYALAVRQDDAMKQATTEGAVRDAYDRQVLYGVSSFALLGLGAVGVGLHFVL